MVPKERSAQPDPTWAYAYRVVGPPAAPRLDTVQLLLDRENAAARRGGWTWSGRIVVEPEITYLLIVTDTPDQDREINRRLEAELIDLGADFAITPPLAIAPAAPPGD